MSQDPLIADRYRRGDLVSEGAATVYRGIDSHQDSPVLLLKPSPVLLAAEGFLEALEDEARAQSALDHPGLLPPAAIVIHEGEPWLVRPDLNDSLAKRFAKDGRSSPELWLPAIAEVLDALHAQDQVHGDLAPAAILFNGVGAPLLRDSVLARARSRVRTGLAELSAPIGAAETLAPETIDGDEGPAADQYALASLGFRALAGRWPFQGAGLSLLVRKTREEAPRIQGPRGEVLARALSRDPAARFPSCAAFAEAFSTSSKGAKTEEAVLEAAPAAPRAPSQGWLRTLQALIAVLVLGGAALITFRPWDRAAEDPKARPQPEDIWDLEPWPAAPDEPGVAEDRPRAPLPRNAAGYPEVPGFRFIGEEEFRCGDQANTVAVYQCLNFASILDVPEGQRDAASEFVLIPKGRFIMGSKARSESPAHAVEIRRSFLLARTELAQAIWRAVIPQQPSTFKDPRKPVEGVSWEDCVAFCRRTGLRLPSEAEWEYAARAGATTDYPWGETMDARCCWYRDNALDGLEKGPREVTAHARDKRWNAFGLVDMLGNVWEWCRDDYIDGYKSGPKDERPRGGRSKRGVRVYRGGCWSFAPQSCRLSSRDGAQIGHRSSVVGFRPACSVE